MSRKVDECVAVGGLPTRPDIDCAEHRAVNGRKDHRQRAASNRLLRLVITLKSTDGDDRAYDELVAKTHCSRSPYTVEAVRKPVQQVHNVIQFSAPRRQAGIDHGEADETYQILSTEAASSLIRRIRQAEIPTLSAEPPPGVTDMSKYGEMLAIMEFAKNAGKDKEPKRWRKRKDPDFIKDLMEYQDKMEKFQKWIKSQEKKEEKKHDGLFPHWSVAKRVTFFTIFGPPLGIAYVFSLVIMTRTLAHFIAG